MGKLTKMEVKTKRKPLVVEEIIVTDFTPDAIVSKREDTKTKVKKRTIKVPLLLPVFQKPRDITFHTVEGVSFPEPFNLSKIRPVERLMFLKAEGVEYREIKAEVFTPYLSHLLDIILKKFPEVHFEEPEPVGFDVTEDVRTPPKKDLNSLSVPVVTPIFLKLSGDVSYSITTEIGLVVAAGSSGEIPEIELPVEDMFSKAFGSGVSFLPEGPVIILAKKPEEKKLGYIEFLKRVLREIYRVRVGGLPTAYHVMLPEDTDRLQSLRAGKSIFVLDWVGKKEPEEELKKQHLKIMTEKVRELFSQGFGFLVFYGNEEFLKWVKHKVFNSVLYISDSGNVKMSLVQKWVKLDLQSAESLCKLIHNFWGFYGEQEPVDRGFDYLAPHLEDKYREFLETYTRTIRIHGKTIPSPLYIEGNPGESLIHYALKAFVFERLVEDYGVNPNDIETEYPEGEMRIDVHVKSQNIAVEIETFYGETLPLLKLRKDVESRLTTKSELWIVLPPTSYVLFKNDVHAFIKWTLARPEYRNRVKVFTVDVNNRKLIQVS
ncbi:hypothetical protein FH039_05310 [Thermococcus indicus]|uniref:Uncharacterized protein n=1 Tax=Thermococcus indicus TaxID=2586643 RepID=A0A4Y5SLT3_9EURY|nr:hypothetical protein [Thermococcus indicus]QDA31132.1 hypothetical protein FH039_05310 [Thermococcus indicus]